MTRKFLCSLIVALGLGLGPGQASDNAESLTRLASQQLLDANEALQSAQNSEDRIAALTETIRAFENGLEAMRDGLRAVTIRERVLQKELDSRREQISKLLGVLQTLERATTPLLLIHPEGALGTARSGMMVTEVTPSLQAQAEELRAQLVELSTLQRLQLEAAEDLELSLGTIQRARVALSEAVGARDSLPKRFADDPVQIAILFETADTLELLANEISKAPLTGEQAQIAPFSSFKGRLEVPAPGQILRRYEEADAAGLKRKGIVFSVPALSLVTMPFTSTIRFAGPFLDYGNVIILEPESGYLIVLAGLETLYVEVGEIVMQGSPIGLLGGQSPGLGDFLSSVSQGSSNNKQESLYIELRENGVTVDPIDWFDFDQS